MQWADWETFKFLKQILLNFVRGIELHSAVQIDLIAIAHSTTILKLEAKTPSPLLLLTEQLMKVITRQALTCQGVFLRLIHGVKSDINGTWDTVELTPEGPR